MQFHEAETTNSLPGSDWQQNRLRVNEHDLQGAGVKLGSKEIEVSEDKPSQLHFLLPR